MNRHWERAAGPAGDIGTPPLLPVLRAPSVSVAVDVNCRGEGCESYGNEDNKLHCIVSNAGGET